MSYHLSFDDAAEIPKDRRADIAMLLRDGYFTLHADLTMKPNRPFSRAKMLRLIRQIYAKKGWTPTLAKRHYQSDGGRKADLEKRQKRTATQPQAGRVFVSGSLAMSFIPLEKPRWSAART